MKKPSSKDSNPFFNRELSWIEFNRRVLSEAFQPSKPLLERLRFIGIVSSNFDEFFMVRVASLKRQLKVSRRATCPSGMTPSDQLKAISGEIHDIVAEQYNCLHEQLIPQMAENGIDICPIETWSTEQRDAAQLIFDREIQPVLSPVRIAADRRLPFTGNLRLYIAFTLYRGERSSPSTNELAIVELPQLLKRFYRLHGSSKTLSLAYLEDIIIANAKFLFPGYHVAEHAVFRISRDADMAVDEERDDDYVEAMEEVLQGRQHSIAVRMQIQSDSMDLADRLPKLFELNQDDVYNVIGPLELVGFNEIINMPVHSHLCHQRQEPLWPEGVSETDPIFDTLQKQDILLHHPYESFEPVIKLLSDAAADDKVLAIKMTLYRTSGKSRIIQALTAAARNDKQVTVLVELKARFDEEQNISWANMLERAGVIVIYGIAELKVHSKAALIIRREREGIRRYAHLGTGNYNEKTATLYTDMSLLTSRDDLTMDVAMFFNALTGYSAVQHLDKLVMAPHALKDRLIRGIDREAERSTAKRPGLIVAKMNSLADPEVIKALYRASQKHVEILLNVRGICMLVPGVKGLSENIRVVSVIGRYLEHSRIFYFHNRGSDEMFMSSADWMPRNLEHRAELMFPVEQEDLKQRLIDLLETFFADNLQAHILQEDGSYKRLQPDGDAPFSAQAYFYDELSQKKQKAHKSPRREFTVRRIPPKTQEDG